MASILINDVDKMKKIKFLRVWQHIKPHSQNGNLS